MRRQVLTSIVMFLALTVLLGLIYPLAVYGIGQVAFKKQADGSLIKVNGQIVGSKLIAEDFTSAKYFHPRPSKAGVGYDGNGYDASASGASNQGPSNPNLIGNVPGVSIDGTKNPYATPTDPRCVPVQATDKDGNDITDSNGNAVYERNKDGTYVCDPSTVPERVLEYRAENNLAPTVKVPVDAVTASFSGLDPDISVANARLQAPRVARARHLTVDQVLALVSKHTDGRGLGFMGEPGVNVLELNLALDGQPAR
ncbi:MAG TPA: potassium-transporting ATPase subunit C [Acidimicrobiia bacterium]|nr:potassium-transporting ATPase subunit C [Acidimicrobiia bacterium]